MRRGSYLSMKWVKPFTIRNEISSPTRVSMLASEAAGAWSRATYHATAAVSGRSRISEGPAPSPCYDSAMLKSQEDLAVMPAEQGNGKPFDVAVIGAGAVGGFTAQRPAPAG